MYLEMEVKLRTVILLIIVSQITGWRPFTVEFKNISYEIFHPDIFDFNVTTTNKIHDIYLNISRDISWPFLNFVLSHDSGNGTFDMVYTNKTSVDACAFLNNRGSNALFNIIYRVLSDYGEMPNRCPLRRKLYKFVNVTIDPEKFPPFMPDHSSFVSAVGWNNENGRKNILIKISLSMIIERKYKNNRKD